ncbi:MAG: UDP-N-acetylmuramate:L-alanyl-gamma-D-glutamyl-meso-diaminopimelate ligase, partial [Gammaproteobacteria bacterium]|nr:UDP-N-acetylmuramate:L-alanyl-gamma-D-glutamyl-meso-diaminopimelate ligase [Gammaproteobacteria bacterium]
MPRSGLIIAPSRDANVQTTLERGCWTPVSTFALAENDAALPDSMIATADQWQAVDMADDGSRFSVSLNGARLGTVRWELMGRHNVANALAALAAARHAGVPPGHGIRALATFGG